MDLFHVTGYNISSKKAKAGLGVRNQKETLLLTYPQTPIQLSCIVQVNMPETGTALNGLGLSMAVSS